MSAPAPGGSPSPPSPSAPGPTSPAVPVGPPLPPMMPPGPPPSSSPPQPPVTPAASPTPPAASPPKSDSSGPPKSPLPRVHPDNPPASSPHPQPPVATPPASSPPTAAPMPTPSPPPVTPSPSPPSPSPPAPSTPSPSPPVMPVPPTPSSSPPVTPPRSPSPPVTPQPPTPSPSPPSPVTPQPPTLSPPSPMTPQPPTPFPPSPVSPVKPLPPTPSPSAPSQPPPAAPAPTTPPAPPLPPGSPPTTPSPSPPKPSRQPPSTAPSPPTPTPPDSTPSPPGGSPPSPPSTSPPSLLPPSSSSSPASSSSPSTPSRAVIGIAAAVAAVVVLGLVAGLFYCSRKRRLRRRRRRRPPPPPGSGDLHGQRLPVTSRQPSHPLASPLTSTPPPMYTPQQQAYSPWQSSGGAGAGGSDPPTTPPPVTGGTLSYADLDAATGGFSDGNLLGQGGFGHVYRGTLRGGQEEVAIKKLRPGSGQGDREFHAEVEIISRVHHRNLVSLVGYCIYGDQRLLVYEYVPNKTLEFHLHGSGRPTLDWPRRWKIAVGAAKGLAYLHEDCRPKIIHRDIKAANILLDYNFEPKVADFGLAKIQPGEDTHVSTRVMGTFGYLAPEYATTGKVNDRSDVFSFGVVLLELITGRRPVLSTDEPYNDETLVYWARPLLTKALEEQVVDELIDPRLDVNYDAHDMQRLIACAAGAVRHTARSRPRMSQIVRYLEGELSMEDLNSGVAPGQSLLHLHEHSGDTTEQMKRIRRMAFVPGTGTVTENVSSDYLSELTSEYGLYPSSSSSGGYTGEVGMRPVTSQPHADTAEGTAQHSGEAMSRRARPPGRAGR
ncbi:hypothetical protein ABZP36_013136 [Zizania latifolia]